MQIVTDRVRSLIGDAAFAALCCKELLDLADVPAAVENYQTLSRALLRLDARFHGDLSEEERVRLETFLPILRAERSWLGTRISEACLELVMRAEAPLSP